MTHSAAPVAAAVRAELRAHWRSWIAIALMAAAGTGLATAAVAGSRRTATAYERFRAATGRADAIVFATQVGVFDANYAPIRALPEVEDAGEFTLAPVAIDEFSFGSLAPNDDHLYRTIDRPLLVAGRLPDPSRADEIVVNRFAAHAYHLHVGSPVTIVTGKSFSGDLSAKPSGGPRIPARVVGIGDSGVDLIFTPDEASFVPSPALLAVHREIPRAGNLIVRLRPGTDVTEFRRHAAAAMHIPSLPVRDLAEDAKRVVHGTTLERVALILFGLAVALATFVLVGQTLVRAVYAQAGPASTFRALGATRSQAVATLAMPAVVALVSAAGVSSVIAYALSSRFPVGLAAKLDPIRGSVADPAAFVAGAVLAFVLLGGAALGAATRATSRASARPRTIERARNRAPITMVIGQRLATQTGRGERALPIRPAIVGAVAAITGLLATFGLVHGIDDALAHPDRSGQVWDASIFPTDRYTLDAIIPKIVPDRNLAAIARQRRVDMDVAGHGLPVSSLESIRGTQAFPVLRGRAPHAADEVLLGPATVRALGSGLGRVIRIGEHPLRVVGVGLLLQTPHFSFDQGVLMTSEGLATIAPADNATADETLLIRLRDRRRKPGLLEEVARRIGPDSDVEGQGVPQDVLFLRSVRTMPYVFAGFLALLGIASVAHVLTSAVRRRRGDLAILRALGLRPRQAAACVLWQAATVGVIAVALGIPAGIVAARWSWRWVANSTPLLYVSPLRAVLVILLVPITLAVLDAIAVAPAIRAARLRPAEILRAE